MVRITSEEHEDCVLLRVEGPLRGPWIDELERVWRGSREGGKHVCVNLVDVLYVDDAAKVLLSRMVQDGIELSASDVYMKAIVQEIVQSAAHPIG